MNEMQSRPGTTGDFYRKVVLQRNGMHLGRSTQGHYVCTVDGELLRGSNHRDAEMIVGHIDAILRRHEPVPVELPVEGDGIAGAEPRPPAGVTVVEVFSRVLEADWPATDDQEQLDKQQSRGRDFLWITADERVALTASPPEFPASLARRLARFHLVDNTRCEGLPWYRGSVHELEVRLDGDGAVRGRAAADADDRRGYVAEFGGRIAGREGVLERFDLVVRGVFHGDGKWSTGAPPGEYVVGIAFRLAESPYAEGVFPLAAGRGLQEYMDAPCTEL